MLNWIKSLFKMDEPEPPKAKDVPVSLNMTLPSYPQANKASLCLSYPKEYGEYS